MPSRSIVFFLLGLVALPVKAETLKGRIVENELRGPGVANVEIVDEAQTTNPTTSDDWGRFNLNFPAKHPGDPVRIVVKRTGYVVVNWEFLNLVLPAATKVDDIGITIIVCPQREYGQCRIRYDGVPADVLKDIVSKFKEQVVKEDEPKEIDFQRYIKEWATQYELSAEQAQTEVERWVAEVQQKRNNISDLALAELYQKHFSKAAQLFQQAAQDKIGDMAKLQRKEEEILQEKKKLTAGVVNDLRGAGDAHYNDYHFEEALASYQKALGYARRETDPQLWAQTQNRLGAALWQQGIRAKGAPGAELLAQAVAAFRRALEVRTREALPQNWAATQYNLGLALYEQALRTEGAKAAELLGQAMAAFRCALEVYTREQLPQQWAMTQLKLGNALQKQGTRTGAAQGTQLLAQAVEAYRSALEVYTREQLPQDWAQTRNGLGAVLWQQGIQAEGAPGTELLAQAVAAFRRALEVRTREALPRDWAATQYNLGLAFYEQALRTEGAKAAELLGQAMAAFRCALEVYTREQLPQQWAMTQNKLGNALYEQALRTEGAKAAELLGQALAAFHSALEVYTPEVFPAYHEEVQANLAEAEDLLKQTKAPR
jgi:tetratricopeptide (TPR) repeat protein